MLTKKYFRAFAELIRDTKTRDELIAALIEFFARDNPRFDADEFRAAAGGGADDEALRAETGAPGGGLHLLFEQPDADLKEGGAVFDAEGFSCSRWDSDSTLGVNFDDSRDFAHSGLHEVCIYIHNCLESLFKAEIG